MIAARRGDRLRAYLDMVRALGRLDEDWAIVRVETKSREGNHFKVRIVLEYRPPDTDHGIL